MIYEPWLTSFSNLETKKAISQLLWTSENRRTLKLSICIYKSLDSFIIDKC